ncbi:oxidoreductase [Nocardia farcinica]|uniref:Phthalate dioxygenase reductase n=1 Tax=Nocardia farcinica TaxID=37329 RepID=A0A449G641_NOCFR|nr:PDR/VanB family oxidoreductase [Nocardia farcinica]MBF6359854.1 oxidoreductase [Nocardia farcinica]VFA91241.1 Phthalate dioxygenase reductase [Nocardia farcinica]
MSATERLTVRITGLRDLGEIRVLDLGATSDRPLPGWEPGAHIELVLPTGLTRRYSLCGDPAHPATYRVAVLREEWSRGGSEYIHRYLRLGQHLETGAPVNNFPLRAHDRYVFIAGGIGITPILPMATRTFRAGAQVEVHCAGGPGAMELARELARAVPPTSVYPRGHTPRMDVHRIVSGAEPGTGIYCCGPQRLLDAVAATPTAADVQLEKFRPTRKKLAPPKPFDAVAVRSGITVHVEPEQSLLTMLEAAGVPVSGSCREGVCGSCRVGVVEGAVDHRDDLLDDAGRERGDLMYPCVSRGASGVLVLDI